MTAIIILIASIPVFTMIATNVQLRRAERNYKAVLTNLPQEGDIEFNRMLNQWISTKGV